MLMRHLFVRLSLATVMALSGTHAIAQDDGSPVSETAQATDEPGLLEKGGPIDETFGVLLGWGSKIPFWNLAGDSTPPKPWLDANGNEVTDEAYEAIQSDYGKILAGKAESPHPFPWRAADQTEIVLSPRGEPVTLGLPFVVLWLVLAAVFFTLMMKFVNVRLFGHAIQVVRGKYDNPDDHGEVTHFQALSSALSATVGLGNIAGVAIAVSLGGPGATVWMIVAGLLGMSLKFTECTLGQRYRDIDAEGRVLGGPMRYLKKGLQARGLGALGVVLSVMFAIFCIGGSLAGGNSFQVSQALTILKQDYPFFEDHGWVFGLVMAVLVGIVILGGIRRIAATASKIVPLMCGLYILMALGVHPGPPRPRRSHPVVRSARSSTGAFNARSAVRRRSMGVLVHGLQAGRVLERGRHRLGRRSPTPPRRPPIAVREGIVALLEPFIDTVAGVHDDRARDRDHRRVRPDEPRVPPP